MAYYAFLCIDEIYVQNNANPGHVTQLADIMFQHEGTRLTSLSLLINNYKHSDFHPKTIFIPCANDNGVCPVVALHDYLTKSRHSRGALFQFPCESAVTHSYVSASLKPIFLFVGLDPHFYKGHSFRIGAAMSAADIGQSRNEQMEDRRVQALHSNE